MEVLVKCLRCGRRKEKEGVGRVIDGSWVDDWRVRGTEAWGKWICSVRCYWEVVEEYGWKYIVHCDEVDE